MKNYLTAEKFIKILDNLKLNQSFYLYLESIEDQSTTKHKFTRCEYCGNDFILFEHPVEGVAIIEDYPLVSWEEVAEGFFEDFEQEEEYKIYIA